MLHGPRFLLTYFFVGFDGVRLCWGLKNVYDPLALDTVVDVVADSVQVWTGTSQDM